MGTRNHHAIVVTSWDRAAVAAAHARAAGIFGALVSGVVDSKMNSFSSFFVPPDGSNEGWEGSAEGDRRRSELVAWMRGEARLSWARSSSATRSAGGRGWSRTSTTGENPREGKSP
jgi:hypothetical protein